MASPRSKRNRFERRLRPFRKKYARVRARVQQVGFVVRGSIDRRRLQCGKPSCRCRQDPSQWHGPYYLVTWKEGGKTVCRVLPSGMVPLYRKWVSNARALDLVLDQMREISRDAADAVRAEETDRVRSTKPPKRHQGRR